MSSFYIIQVGPKSNNKCSYKIDKRRPQKNGGIGLSYAAASQGMPGVTSTRRGNEGLSPRAFRGSMVLLTL